LRVLVTGGAGYIGTILCRQLIEAGHTPVVLDRFFWGYEPLAGLDVETISGDIRDLREDWFDGVDAVCHLGGLSNDPTAEYNTDANWQMNAVATARLVEMCKRRGIERFTFASSASIYDTESSSSDLERSPIMCDETTDVQPRGAYSLSKREAEKIVLSAADETFAPVIFRQGTVYGYSPRMRFDLVVNTFIKDAVLHRRLFLHGGGWMWRPLVDVLDVARVHVAALSAPLGILRGQIFNVLEENYQIRQLAMLVAGSLALLDPPIRVDLTETPLPKLVRNYRMSNGKLTKALNFTPSITVLESITDMLAKLPIDRVDEFGHPRYYNIRWMTLLENVHETQSRFSSIY
jgi:nucleoside-diphosphate-sugar epimerase